MAERAEDQRPEFGYQGDGASRWSHLAAGTRRRTIRKIGTARNETLRQQIAREERWLRDLKVKAQSIKDPERLAHTLRDISAKTNFINHLWSELAKQIKAGKA